MKQPRKTLSSSRHHSHSVLTAIALLTLAACGGGGFKTNVSLTVSPQALSVTAALSDAPPTGTLYLGADGLTAGQEVYVFANPTTNGITSVVRTSGSFLPVVLAVNFEPPPGLGVGAVNDTIKVSMCFDKQCTQPLNNSPQTIPVQYTVTKSTLPPLKLNSISPTSVTVGGPSFMLTILGSGFSTYATVKWNSTPLTTTYVSATELVAQVPVAAISVIGSASITVHDPGNSITDSSHQTLTIAAASKDAVAFQNNAAHTGAVTFANLSFPTSAKWSVDVGYVPSYAIVTHGKVIVTASVFGASKLLALDQATGSTVWGPIALSAESNATYDAGRVYVLIAPLSAEATLQAYDVDTGALDWSTTLAGQFSFTAAPTAANGLVFVGGSGNSGTLYAVDESTGKLVWTQTVFNGDDSAPAVSADGVYVTYPCQTYDIRPATGEIIWQKNTGCSGGGGATPVVMGQLLYSPIAPPGYDGDIFNAETGDDVGTFAADAPPAFTSTFGYYLKSGTLSGVTLTDNKQQWTFTGDGHLQGAPLAVDQYVFIGSSAGNLYALDSTTGLQAWNVSLGTAIDAQVDALPLSGLAAGDGLLIVPAGTKVFAYTLSTNP